MRNSKVKGFTLIELIVVIAIIGILAAILVPSMLGYVRNARISSANAGAKQVHTACSSALTQLGIANWDWGADKVKEGTIVIKESVTADGNDKGVSFTGVKNPPKAAQLDLGSYLGEDFKDFGIAVFQPETYSVSHAGYATTSAGWGVVSTYKTKELMEGVNEAKQKQDAKDGKIYGIYPAPKVST